MSSAHHTRKTGRRNGDSRELKSISHDVFNVMTVMYGLQEALQAIPAEDETLSRAVTDFNQVVTKLQQIGDRLLKLYREEGGTPRQSGRRPLRRRAGRASGGSGADGRPGGLNNAVFTASTRSFRRTGFARNPQAPVSRMISRGVQIVTGSHEKHFGLGQLGVRADLLGDLEAVHSGHHDVEQDELGLLVADVDQRRDAVVDHVHVEAPLGLLEVAAQSLGDLDVVFDDQTRAAACRGSLARGFRARRGSP